MHDKKHENLLPMMSLHLTNITYDQSRSTMRPMKLTLKNAEEKALQIYKPTPYTFSYQLNIGSLYLNEADQILEQILPYFEPNISINVKIPLLNFDYDARVIINSVSNEVTEDYSDDTRRFIK